MCNRSSVAHRLPISATRAAQFSNLELDRFDEVSARRNCTHIDEYSARKASLQVVVEAARVARCVHAAITDEDVSWHARTCGNGYEEYRLPLLCLQGISIRLKISTFPRGTGGPPWCRTVFRHYSTSPRSRVQLFAVDTPACWTKNLSKLV